MTTFSRLRQKTGLSVQEVAERVGFDERTVYRWERGETNPRKPVIELMQTLAVRRKAPNQSVDFTFIDLFAGWTCPEKMEGLSASV